MHQIKSQDGKNYLSELFYETELNKKGKISKSSIAWMEGWVCGFTDPYHGHQGDETTREELLQYLKELRGGR